MSKLLELQEKRANIWEQAKAFLDEKQAAGDTLSTEDAATYDKMEADVMALGKEIDRLKTQAAIDLELSRPASTAIVNKPAKQDVTKHGRFSDAYAPAFWDSMRGKSRPEHLKGRGRSTGRLPRTGRIRTNADPDAGRGKCAALFVSCDPDRQRRP